MERIKQALDKAKAEQSGGVVQRSALENRESKDSKAPIVETSINYSQTRVTQLNSAHLARNRIISGEDDQTLLAAYKMLRTQIMQRMAARGWSALAITSATPEDGKTITSINLAISLARELNQTVLLVDMDLQHPSIHRYLGFQPESGIGDFLLGKAPINEVMINPGLERLVVMPGRAPVSNSSEILASQAMGDFVSELKSRYPSRMVLFDMPPVLATDDTLAFAPYIDAFLLVIREAKSTFSEVERATELLEKTPIIGTVLNASSERISAYY